ncbi:MAG TPA: rRNA pseudouridine synthase [Firmicutes bacterium]|nr:rRNA pseudouridine synthase [Bacillota bacterium]
MRINRYLAECGLASRRKCEEFVTEGRVTVNGKVITDLSTQIEAGDVVTVGGKRVSPVSKHVYLMLNKPKGCVTTVSDDRGRKTVMDIVRADYPDTRLFPVGRLDYDTEGLLILTTDGDLCNRLTHPSSEIEKVYTAKTEGRVTEDDLAELRRGVVLGDGKKTGKCRAYLLSYDSKTNISTVEVAIKEGMNREVRRMFEAIGKNVVFLKRVAIGDLRLRGVDRGSYRKLTREEVEYLKNV